MVTESLEEVRELVVQRRRHNAQRPRVLDRRTRKQLRQLRLLPAEIVRGLHLDRDLLGLAHRPFSPTRLVACADPSVPCCSRLPSAWRRPNAARLNGSSSSTSSTSASASRVRRKR